MVVHATLIKDKTHAMEHAEDTPTLVDFIEPTDGKWEVIEDEGDADLWIFLCDGEERLYTCSLPMVQDALALFLSHAKQRREEALRVLTHQPDNVHALMTLTNAGKDLREIRHYQATLTHENPSKQAGK